jgi:DNA polymerase
MDCETYSEAGYYWDGNTPRVLQKGKTSISIAGAAAYAEHPTTEIVFLDYWGNRWIPGTPEPQALFDYIANGGIIEAHNSIFEFFIWHYVCHLRMGWPPLPIHQLRDSMAKCYAHSLPGKLEKAAPAIGSPILKDNKGTFLIKKCSCPRKPTKQLPYRRLLPVHDPESFSKFYEYGSNDVKAQAELSSRIPDLSPFEQKVWLTDQAINIRGVHVDTEGLNNCISIIEQAKIKYTEELQDITGGAIKTADEIEKIKEWLAGRCVPMETMQAEDVEDKIKELPECIERRVLEIRSVMGARSVQKLYSMKYQLSGDNRLRGLFQYAGADRTARWAGRGPQPQNLPSGGPDIIRCQTCGGVHWAGLKYCPYTCGLPSGDKPEEWGIEAVEIALNDIATRSLSHIESTWGDPVATVSGCLRGLFTAAPGHDLICSDYSSIEAVALAELAGETWRQEVFRTHGKIYEACLSKITGIPLQEILDHKVQTGQHHPLRKKLGKIPELASGYGGAWGAWLAFGADKYMTKDEGVSNIKKWRKDNPNIVDYWWRIGDTAVNAVLSPGQIFQHRGIQFQVIDDILYCKLLSGRYLTYHKPRVTVSYWPSGHKKYNLSYMGWNSDYKKGPIGWLRIDTYGPKIVENITQAHCRDVLAYALVNLEARSYPIVLHVHDEPAAEVIAGTGSIKEFESTMCIKPQWCIEWPIKASGGWRGLRYRKE